VSASSIHDVIVVGAGPAGATAARTLAERGVRTLLIDRATFPRSKPCGGAITARALIRFPHLRSALHRISTHWISKVTLQGPNGRSAEMRSGSPAVLTIRRVEFDALLVALARQKGVELLDGTEIHHAREDDAGVQLQTRGGRVFTARMVIAADGVHGVIARRLHLSGGWRREALAVDLMEETPNTYLHATDPDCLWVSYGFPASSVGGPASLCEGYAYVFPKQTHVNVGIGYLSSRYRTAFRGRAYALQRGLIDLLIRDGVLAGESRSEHFTPFVLPVGGPIRRTGTRRVLVAGDAGGFVNGFTAEGIYYAMVSGDLAATAAADALGNGVAAHRSYRAMWKAEIGGELEESVALQRFFFTNPSRIDALVAGASDRSGLVDAITRWAAGSDGYSDLRRLIVRRNPAVGIVLGAMLLKERFEATRRTLFQSKDV
jgi:geranylgeranyl reductase family protein